jgi:hypothetical protein
MTAQSHPHKKTDLLYTFRVICIKKRICYTRPTERHVEMIHLEEASA